MTKGTEKTQIPWHPGFYGAAELELIGNKKDLEFHREYNLSKEPLRMDLLIIKKLREVKIENEIGQIFKKHNILEYKSPEDGLGIDDYYKTVGYACLYKGLGETENQIPAEEITVSIFRESYPRELFKALKKEGQKIEERFPGIYYISGHVLFDTQIIVMRRVEAERHRGLKMLNHNVSREDVKAFLKEIESLKEPGDRNNIDAVMHVSAMANWKLYEAIGRDRSMFEVLKGIFKDELERERQETAQRFEKEKQEAVQETAKETEKRMIEKLLKSGKNAPEEIAEYCAEFTLKEIQEIEASLIKTAK